MSTIKLHSLEGEMFIVYVEFAKNPSLSGISFRTSARQMTPVRKTWCLVPLPTMKYE